MIVDRCVRGNEIIVGVVIEGINEIVIVFGHYCFRGGWVRKLTQ
jgi:hypothetical protein